MASALTAALQFGQAEKKQSPNALPNVNLHRSAFPCLYQDEASKEDDFEIDLSLNKLSLGASPGLSFRGRSSLDGNGLQQNPDATKARSKAAMQDSTSRWEKLGSQDMVSRFMSPGSLGSSLSQSLPKPMLPSARKASGLDTPSPSPHLASFKEIAPEQLGAQSAEGRRLRRRVLRGTVLVCIVAGYQGKRFIYERAKELGIRMVIIDSPESKWVKEMEDDETISKFVPIDFNDEAAVFDKCLAAIKDIEKEYKQVDGVISFWELSQPLVARLAEQLGLPGNPPDAVDNARDKQRTRDVMRAAGLPTPKNMAVGKPEDLPKAAEVVGFPAVLKPTSGAASLGVIKVETLGDLDRVYRQVCKEVATVTETADGHWTSAGIDDEEVVVEEGTGAKYVAQTFIMEQYLDGPEVDVDLLLSCGEPVYGAISDNWPCIEPYFNETGSNSPSILPLDQQRALCELSVAAAQCLGFQMGVLHVEAKFTSHGPHLIEVNARLGGGPVSLMNELVWGVDLVEEQMLASAGIPSKPYIAARPSKYVAEYSVNAKQTGIIKSLDFCQEFEGQPNVVYCRPLVSLGDRVVAIEDGMPTWIYEVLVTGPTTHQAIEFVKAIDRRIEPLIPIEPRKSKATPHAPT